MGTSRTKRFLVAVVFVPGLFSCQDQWRNIRTFQPHERYRSDSVFFWQKEEVGMQSFAEEYLAHRFGVVRDGEKLEDFFHEVCPGDIRWDTLYRFGSFKEYEVLGTMSYLDVEFPKGPPLRLIFGGRGDFAAPVYGDKRDLNVKCKYCPDSLSVKVAQDHCGENPPASVR